MTRCNQTPDMNRITKNRGMAIINPHSRATATNETSADMTSHPPLAPQKQSRNRTAPAFARSTNAHPLPHPSNTPPPYKTYFICRPTSHTPSTYNSFSLN
ncbi:hypothetical protein J6590_040211 [Homalodisca vitripennis]|nr:hypothetical protein J6590_040211 [Homalodisca vitripennis]